MKKRSLLVFLITTLLIILPFVFIGCAPTKAYYTVEYYLQNIENNEFTLDTTHTYTAQGLIDGSAVENPKTIEGFTFTNNNSTLQGMVREDGSLTLKLYYTRNTFTLSANATSAGSISKSGTIKYGESITCTATPNPCYNFIGWYSGETLLSTENTYTFTATQDVTAKFEVKPELSNFTFTATGNSFVITGIKDENATEVIIPNGVTSIGEYAFRNCDSLTSIIIGDSVTSIGNDAFYYCTSLTSIEIPDSVTSIGEYAFFSCDSLSSVTIGNSVTSIGNDAFYDCDKLVEVINKSSHITIKKGSESNGCVGYYALVVYNSGDTFTGTKLSNDNGYIIYTEGNEKILVGYNGTETELVLPTYITKIYQYAFRNCDSLISVIIGDSVTSIGNKAFYDCDSLSSVVIGDSVTSIGNYAFDRCDKLVEVINKSSHITIGKGSSSNGCVGYYALVVYNSDDTFTGTKLSNDNGYIIYTEGNEKILVGYNGTETELVLPTYITKINRYAFYYCTNLTSVTIGDSVTNIGSEAFRGCGSLTSVTIPDSVTSIGNYAFCDCDSLTSVTIGDSVTSIGYDAFFGCSSLTSINFNGTKAQWNAISKGSYWKYNVKATYVTCTDGKVSI